MKLVIFFILIFIRFGISNDEVKLKNIDNNNCLQLASYPDGSIQGVESSKLNSNEAITACKKAIKSFPDKPIFKTLLARSYEAKLEMNKALDLFKEASNAGEKYAQYGLAAFYFNGNIVVKDFKKAFDLSMKSAKQGNTNAMFAIGYNFFNGFGVDVDYKKAIIWYKKAAQGKNSFAFYNLGHLYHNGHGVDVDYVEAIKWYKKAALNNNSRAQHNIAMLYAEGKGVDKSHNIAFEWFKKAATNKNPITDAMVNLGYYYGNGLGVKKDNKKALNWYLKAANKGSPIAQHNIATFYEAGTLIKKDLAKAYAWYLKAAKQGYDKSEYNLGIMYLNGSGIDKNNEIAIKWLKKAANKGLPQAQYNLALIYSNESYKEFNLEKALEWYTKAATNNYPEAIYNLAILYENGRGLDKDIDKAFNLYISAANLGLDVAQYNLAYYYQDGKAGNKDLDEAYKWFLKASEQDLHEAVHQVAYYLELGLGKLEKNLNKAVGLYETAAFKGNVFSQIRLGQLYEEQNNIEKEKTSKFWYELAIKNRSISESQQQIAESYFLKNSLESELVFDDNDYFENNNKKDEQYFIETTSKDKIKVFIPENFCNGNNKKYGKEHLNNLVKMSKTMDGALTPKYVFYPCERVSDYPYGMIQFHPQKDQYYSQEHLNKDIMKDLDDQTIFNDLTQLSDNINKTHKENDTKVVIKEFNKPQALWKDSNAFIFTLRLKGQYDGEEVVEIQTISVTYYNGYLIYYYINELESESIPGHNIKILLDVAKRIKAQQHDTLIVTTNNKDTKFNSFRELGVISNNGSEKRLALLVANQNYKNSPLTNPISDVELLGKTLKDKNFKVFVAKNLDYKNFRSTLNSFNKAIKKSGENSVVLFYYAGHGLQYEGNNFLIPVNSNINNSLDIELESINLERVFSSMYNSEGVKIILLDACRNNPYKSFMRSPSRGLVQVTTPSGTIVGYSTSPGKVAEDGFGSNSPYALSLSNAIKIPNLKIEEVLKRTRISVMEKTTNQQIPWDSSSLTKEFYFSIN